MTILRLLYYMYPGGSLIMVSLRCPVFSVIARGRPVLHCVCRASNCIFDSQRKNVQLHRIDKERTDTTQSIHASTNNIFTRHSPTCRQPEQQHFPYPPTSPKTLLHLSPDSVLPAPCSAVPGKAVAKGILHANSADTHHSMNPYQGSEF